MVGQNDVANLDAGFALWLDVLRTLALLVAGWFGYVRFLRGRTFHSALDPVLTAELLEIGSGKALRVTAQIENTGSFRMDFPDDCSQELILSCADAPVWVDGVANGEVLWTEGATRFVDLLVEEAQRPERVESLEPGQTVVRDRLVPVPEGEWLAYRVTLKVKCRARLVWRSRSPRTWETHLVVKET